MDLPYFGILCWPQFGLSLINLLWFPICYSSIFLNVDILEGKQEICLRFLYKREKLIFNRNTKFISTESKIYKLNIKIKIVFEKLTIVLTK